MDNKLPHLNNSWEGWIRNVSGNKLDGVEFCCIYQDEKKRHGLKI